MNLINLSKLNIQNCFYEFFRWICSMLCAHLGIRWPERDWSSSSRIVSSWQRKMSSWQSTIFVGIHSFTYFIILYVFRAVRLLHIWVHFVSVRVIESAAVSVAEFDKFSYSNVIINTFTSWTMACPTSRIDHSSCSNGVKTCSRVM
jgi:hypothetical protein